MALMQALRNLEANIQTERISRGINNIVPIWLHINSSGGDLFSAFAVADQIRQLETPVYSIVEGYVASAATIISTACTRRYIQPHSFLMIHLFSSWFYGTHEDLKNLLGFQEKMLDKFTQWYVQHTSLTQTAIEDKLKQECTMSAEEALKDGFVDEICGNV
jgi:ATP-dependent Clp protease protease subunit